MDLSQQYWLPSRDEGVAALNVGKLGCFHPEGLGAGDHFTYLHFTKSFAHYVNADLLVRTNQNQATSMVRNRNW